MSEGSLHAVEASRVEVLAADLRRRRSELGDQHRELNGLIKQTVAEMDRAGQLAREAAGRLKQIESNPERFTNTEVKRAYAETQEAQMRQFMMQTQLEQFRNRLSGLDSTDELLRQLIGSAEELAEAAQSLDEREDAPRIGTQPEQTSQTLEGAALTFRGIELALQRLSRQLQDEQAQLLSDLILRAEVCERLVDMDKQRAKTEVTRLKQAAAVALKSTRQLVQELRSPALEESGLAAALRRYVESLKASDKLQVDLHIVGPEQDIPRAVEMAAFRIVQEALANTAAHSGTKRAEVRVQCEPHELAIVVADEGRGFEVNNTLAQAREKEHAGLLDMQLRAELIGASLELSSTPGSGCLVSLTIPM